MGALENFLRTLGLGNRTTRESEPQLFENIDNSVTKERPTAVPVRDDVAVRDRHVQSLDSPKTLQNDFSRQTVTDLEPFVPYDPSELGEKVFVSPEILAVTIYHAMEPSKAEMRTAQWLGDSRAWNNSVLFCFCQLFEWTDSTLVQSVRNFCAKVFLKGETQHIGRCLSAVADRWVECNPNHVFKSSENVLRIIYAIVLLNQDLHGSRDSGHVPMTSKQFLKSVLAPIFASEVTPNSEGSRISHSNEQGSVFQATMERNAPLEPETSSNTQNATSEHQQAIQNEWARKMRKLLQLIYTDVSRTEIRGPPVTSSPEMKTPLNSVSSLDRRASTHSRSSRRKSSLSYLSSMSQQGQSYAREGVNEDVDDIVQDDPELGDIATSSPPCFKEGPLSLYSAGRVFNRNNAGRVLSALLRPAMRGQWIEVFATVYRGHLRLYQVLPSKRPDTGEGDWTRRSRLLNTVRLSHTIAQLSGDGKSGEWSLLVPDGNIIRLQCASSPSAHEFVYTCNYWAARLSKPPLTDIISSTEFGWGTPVELYREAQRKEGQLAVTQGGHSHAVIINGERVTIQQWAARAESPILSKLSIVDQLESLRKYVAEVDDDIAAHSSKSAALLAIFTPDLPVSQRVMNNWELRSQYFLVRSAQYTQYVKTLERVLSSTASGNGLGDKRASHLGLSHSLLPSRSTSLQTIRQQTPS